MGIKISVYPTHDPDGEDLFTRIETLAAELYGHDARVVPGRGGPGRFLVTCATSDLVVIDVTVAPEGKHNYDLLVGIERHAEHVLFVGRGYTAMNVRGCRAGGMPNYPFSQTNEKIIAWMRKQLAGLGALHLPRPWHQKLTLGATSLTDRPRGGSAANRQGQVFISYRSSQIETARRVKERIEGGGFGEPRTVVLYEPEEFVGADQVLTPLQRWNVLAIISDVILGCEEFWIVHSDDYEKSWWVRGELATFAYRRPARLCLYDPVRDEVRDVPGYVPAMTEEQKNRMSRFFTNSHPDMMAPESVHVQQHLAATGSRLGGGFSRDQVFTDGFWNDPLLQCSRCSLPGSEPEPIDHARFLANQYPVLHPVSADDLRRAAGTEEPVPCPGCGMEYRIVPVLPRYLWYPLRLNLATGKSLEEFPSYRTVPV